jgi:hypothetical protein
MVSQAVDEMMKYVIANQVCSVYTNFYFPTKYFSEVVLGRASQGSLDNRASIYIFI